jgi:uncharacterized protein YcbK (DUF882 family)
VANGDTRTISLYHVHTKETIEATYRVNGQYDPAVLEKLNWFLRDWRRDEPTKMDPRLFDVVWEVYRTAGTSEPITIFSAYRSPETNAMLRHHSRAVAKYSQHMLGKAMDTTMPGMSMERIREIGMRLQRGGVGYYPGANFVHLDVGSVRHWPRMSFDQLARLFPDGKTVHIPSNGQPLARYEEARAEIEANGGFGSAPPASKSQGFFAWLFGGGNGAITSGADEDDEIAPAPSSRGRRSQLASVGARAGTQTFVSSGDDGGRNFIVAEAGGRGRSGNERAEGRGGVMVASAARTPAAAQSFVNSRERAAVEEAQNENTSPEAKISPFGELAPLPPRRPTELLAMADIPLPPARPLAAIEARAPELKAADLVSGKSDMKSDAIANLIASTPANTPPVRVASLPGVITQGTSAGDRKAPEQALAYAPANVLADARSPSSNRGANEEPLYRSVTLNVTPAPKGAVVPARLDRSNFRAVTGASTLAQMTSQSVLGATFGGLRQAALVAESPLSNHPLSNGISVNYVSRFGAIASELDVHHFTGSALRPLTSRTNPVLMVDSSLRRGD